MKTKANKLTIALGLICLTLFALADNAAVTNVTVRQRWPWDRKVDINYQLTADPGQAFDVSLTARNGSQVLSLPVASLSGDLYGVEQGQRRIVWDPMVTSYTNETLTQFNVSLTPTNRPLYMIIDLTKTAGAEGQIEYVYSDDARLAPDGNWYSITNDTTYMTTKLVLRRVSHGSFLMAKTTSVTLSKDYYVGVFEVTQAQWNQVMGNWPSYYNNVAYRDTRPVEQVSYTVVRGAPAGSPAVDWPATGSTVSPTSFIGQLRTQTGLSAFDLPTDAQWEYACRSGTTTDLSILGGVNLTNTISDANMNLAGRYLYNGGTNSLPAGFASIDPSRGTATVGSYLPNAWGIYDMHGNVWEVCLDWFGALPATAVDPIGVSSGTYRVSRSGSWWNNPSGSCTSWNRINYNATHSSWGLRVTLQLP